MSGRPLSWGGVEMHQMGIWDHVTSMCVVHGGSWAVMGHNLSVGINTLTDSLSSSSLFSLEVPFELFAKGAPMPWPGMMRHQRSTNNFHLKRNGGDISLHFHIQTHTDIMRDQFSSKIACERLSPRYRWIFWQKIPFQPVSRACLQFSHVLPPVSS